MSAAPSGTNLDIQAVADAFVGARRQARALPGFPGGVLPPDLATGYRIQDRAIARWPERIAGWKVGWIAPDRREPGGDDRVVGPVFRDAVWPAAPGQVIDVPVFVGGFAAVEAEYVFRLGADATPGVTTWTADTALALVAALHIGIETAGSPLATINQLGPTVVAADFGNNAGLVLGGELAGWRDRGEATLHCETFVAGQSVGRGGAGSVPGGLGAALAFALNCCARRGLPLRAGMLVTTGAATGIHDIVAGQSARITFAEAGELLCRAVAAQTLDPQP